MDINRRGVLIVVPVAITLVLWASACDGSGSTSPTPAPAVSPSPEITVSPVAEPTPSPPPTPVNPDNVEAQVPIFPEAEPTSGISGQPRFGATGISPADYESIFEAQFLTQTGPEEVMKFYIPAMGAPPYSWEQFINNGSGLLIRVAFTKQEGRYAAWIMAFTTATGADPTWILIDVGRRIDSAEGEPSPAP